MKTLFTLLLTLATFSLSAGQYDSYPGQQETTMNGGTNIAAVLSTNTHAVPVFVNRSEYVAIYVGTRLHTSNYCNTRFELQRSLDNSTWDTLNPFLVSLVGATNAGDAGYISVITNINVGSVPYLRLRKVANMDHHGIMTNVVFTYGVKR